jgi:membrane protein required for colicin V production
LRLWVIYGFTFAEPQSRRGIIPLNQQSTIDMTALDYFVVIVTAASVVSGARKGLLKVALSFASTVLGLIAAGQLYGAAGILFSPFTSSAHARNLMGFVTVFLAVLVAGSLLSRMLRGGLKLFKAAWFDNALGGAFGLLRAWLVCSVIYLGLTAFPVKLAAVEEAAFAPVLLRGTRVLAYLTSSEMREQFRDGYEKVQAFWKSENNK